MGGIIGKLSFDPHEPLARPVLEQMLDASRHRATGRDIFTAPGIALGCCGDTAGATVAAHEFPPLRVAADSSLTNAASVRAELAAHGRACDTDLESELILHAYAQWGTACFARFRGPFVCAIWDGTERRLVLARDPVGIRPLHFALLPNHGVVFATDIRALLRDPGVHREWCPAAIDAYLTLGYVPAPLTAYRRISKLEAAHFLIVEGRRLHVEQYWDIPAYGFTPRRGTIDQLADDLREVLAEHANEGRADAILYSGGVGSTTLLASAPAPIPAVITSALDLEEHELVRSDRAARHLGYTREIEAAEPQIPVLARELAAHCDAPIADPAAISQLALCLAAARHTECALAATGAATLWSGHARHGVARNHRDDARRRALYTRAFAWEVREANPLERHLALHASRGGADPRDRALYVDALTFLPDSELVIAEHAAAAAGLELRYPFLDRDLVARAGLTPVTLKRHAGLDMYALRRVLERALPHDLMPPPQRGVARYGWLDGALAALVPTMLLAPRFDGRGIVSRPALRQLWDEHCRGKADHGRRLWSLLMLEFWFRDSIDGNAAEEPVEYAVLRAA